MNKPIWNQAAADVLIPDYMQGGLRLYLELGIMPGDFLLAILRNDLKGACANADNVNKHRIYHYVVYLYGYAPDECFGSPEKVEAWVKFHQLKLA
jgi:hypothetical protein